MLYVPVLVTPPERAEQLMSPHHIKLQFHAVLQIEEDALQAEDYFFLSHDSANVIFRFLNQRLYSIDRGTELAKREESLQHAVDVACRPFVNKTHL